MSKKIQEPWQWSAQQMRRAILRGQISSRAVTESVLSRLKSQNPCINAVTTLLKKEALKAADAADRALKRGVVLGPLHGIPVTMKENIDHKGLPTPNGMIAFAKRPIAKVDSPPAAAWRNSGAVIIGRTNCPAFSLLWTTDNDLHGCTYNPHDRGLTCGGSSGGAGAAVAAGIAPLAHGNDMGGSIRVPAYACGIVGLRPSVGRIAAFNDTSPTERPLGVQLMSVQGPLARTVGDLRLGFQAFLQANANDPWQTPARFNGPTLPRPLPVAVAVDERGDWHDDVASAMHQAALHLEKSGYVVHRVRVPVVPEAAQCWAIIVGSEVRELMLEYMRMFGGPKFNRAWDFKLANMPEVDSVGYKKAMSMRTRYARAWSRLADQYPIIITPVSTQPQFETAFDTKSVQRSGEFMDAIRYVLALSVVGLPVVAMPIRHCGTLIPPSVQIISRRFREDLCLQAAGAIEEIQGKIHPVDPR